MEADTEHVAADDEEAVVGGISVAEEELLLTGSILGVTTLAAAAVVTLAADDPAPCFPFRSSTSMASILTLADELVLPPGKAKSSLDDAFDTKPLDSELDEGRLSEEEE